MRSALRGVRTWLEQLPSIADTHDVTIAIADRVIVLCIDFGLWLTFQQSLLGDARHHSRKSMFPRVDDVLPWPLM